MTVVYKGHYSTAVIISKSLFSCFFPLKLLLKEKLPVFFRVKPRRVISLVCTLVGGRGGCLANRAPVPHHQAQEHQPAPPDCWPQDIPGQGQGVQEKLNTI